MNVIVSYECPVCNQGGFESLEKAEACRDSHMTPDQILTCSYYQEKAIPWRVMLSFPGGFDVLYQTIAGTPHDNDQYIKWKEKKY